MLTYECCWKHIHVGRLKCLLFFFFFFLFSRGVCPLCLLLPPPHHFSVTTRQPSFIQMLSTSSYIGPICKILRFSLKDLLQYCSGIHAPKHTHTYTLYTMHSISSLLYFMFLEPRENFLVSLKIFSFVPLARSAKQPEVHEAHSTWQSLVPLDAQSK
jgi:hypothetical protein